MDNDIRKTLEALRSGEISVDDALLSLKKQPFEDLGYAKVDHHRQLRQGAAEVIYGAGKTVEQIDGIVQSLTGNGVGTVLITRMPEEYASVLSDRYMLDYDPLSKTGIMGISRSRTG